jgi:prepilin-type processing-associated H-X9-DG protein
MAISALVLGILSFFTFGLTAIPALIFGIISLVIIEKSGGRITGRGFAITGIVAPVLGLVPLMGILLPALSRTKEQGKRAVCLNNLKQLSLAWIMYADSNDDFLVNGAIGYSNMNTSWGDHTDERAWVDVFSREEEEAKQSIMDGALWPYAMNLKIYRCPTGRSGEALTYAIMMSMNAVNHSSTQGVSGAHIKKRSEIRNPAPTYRLVFIDQGRMTPDAFAVYYDQQKWWDSPPMRHGEGTTLSFADGHSDYWKWKGTDTIKHAREEENTGSQIGWAPTTPAGFRDLYKMQKGCWGRLGYTPTYP